MKKTKLSQIQYEIIKETIDFLNNKVQKELRNKNIMLSDGYDILRDLIAVLEGNVFVYDTLDTLKENIDYEEFWNE